MKLESGASRLAERIARTQAEILARTLSALADNPKPEALLGQVLSVLVEHCGAQGGSLWLDDPQLGKASPLLEHVHQVYALEGKTLTRRHMAQLAERGMFSTTKAAVQQVQRGSVVRHGWRDIMENEAYQPHREFLVREGTRDIAHVPLFFGQDYRGFITLCFGGGNVLKLDDEPFAVALANQAVVALELSRATAEAREVEIGKQNQLVAEERVAELGRVNLVLRDAVSGLQNLESFEAFVRQTLSTAAEITGAKGSALLFVLENSRTFVVQHLIRNGEWIDVEGDPDYASWHEANSAYPANFADLFDNVFRGPEVWWVTVDDPLLPPRQREFHRRQGHASVAHVPLWREGRPLGFMGLSFQQDERPPASRLELAKVLAHQVTLAYEFRRLGAESQNAAVMRERAAAEAHNLKVSRQNQVAAEERVAELARVNTTLSSAISGLVNLEDLEAFIDQTLYAATEIVGAAITMLFLADAGGRRMAVQHAWACGKRIDLANDPDFAIYRAPEWADTPAELNRLEGLFLRPEDWWVTVDDSSMLEKTLKFHKSRGHVSVARVPLRQGGRTLGFIGLGFTQPGRPPQAKLELVRVLAEQLTLAFELRRLGAESRDAAVARERAAAKVRDLEISRQNQSAAEERVAELVRVNAALSSALSGLQNLEDLETFVYETLGAAAELAGAFRSSLFLADESSRRMTPQYALEGERRIDVDNDSEYVAYRELEASKTTEELDLWSKVFLKPADWWVTLDDPSVSTPSRVFHRSCGHTSIARVPLWRNGCPIGFIGLVFTHDGRPPQAKLELVRVLAEQLTLAFELRRLGAESRDAAVAREREAAKARELEISKQGRLLAEERVAELMGMNAVLSNALSGLQNLEDLEAFVYQTLNAAIVAAGANDCALFLVDGNRRRLALSYVWEAGNRIDVANDPKFARFRLSEGEETPEELERWTRLFLEPKEWWIRADDPSLPAASRNFHSSLGHVSVARVPLWRDSCPLGFIGLGFSQEDRPPQERLELVKVLAEQLTLAFEFQRLGTESRDAAVARERAAAEARDLEVSRQNQLAAEKRVAELVRVNAALSSALSDLQHFEGLETFLCKTLTAAVSIFGATGATLFLADRDRRRMVVEYGVRDGKPIDVALDPDYAPWHGSDKADTPDDLDFWEWVFRNPRYSWMAVDDPSMPSLAQELATRRGQVSVAIVPLWREGRPLGFIGLGFMEPGRPTQTQLELVRVVAQQVTMAYEFTRLGVESREAAVALEREHALVSRLTQLETSNAALARSTAELSVQNDLDAYLGSLLQTLLHYLQAGSASLWLLQPDGPRRLAARATEDAAKSFAMGEPCTDKMLLAKKALLAIIECGCPQPRRSPWMVEDVATTPLLAGHDPIRAMLISSGVRALLDIPVTAGVHYYGSIMVCLGAPCRWTAEKVELAQTQANQAALAMEMSRLGELARQSAIAEERNRFAREIHDTLAQDFLAIAAHLQSARRKLAASDLSPAKAGPITAALDIALGTAQDGLVEARRSVWALVPRALAKGEGLVLALRAAVDRIAPDRAAVCETGVSCPLPVEVEGELLGIVREALSNAARHAGPHASIDVCIRYEKDAVHVSVEDDGAGCDLAATENPRAGHFGLWTMRERAARIGGRLEVLSAAGKGTCVTICVPWGPDMGPAANPMTSP